MGRLLVLAILSDRRAVAPPVPCSSAWITSRIPESWNGIDQAPYRSDWHEGERVWNGVQTSKCRFRPGPQEEAAGGARAGKPYSLPSRREGDVGGAVGCVEAGWCPYT
jgi:hypothetical protein